MKDIYKDILYDYQKEIVDKAMLHDRYGLFLEMSLGKSYITQSIIQKKNIKKMLIISPTNKVDEWVKDIIKNLDMKAVSLDHNPKKDQLLLDNFVDGAIVAHFKKIVWREQIINYIDKDWVLVVDESQYAKSRRSKVGKLLAKISKQVGHVILLSGTPITNKKIEEWYNQLVLLGLNLKFSEFENKFLIKELMKNRDGKRWMSYTGTKNEDILYEAIKSQATFLDKSVSGLKLPEKIIVDIKFKHEKIKVYRNIKKHMIFKDMAIETKGALFLRTRQYASGFIEKYNNESNHKKIALKELLESNNNNMLIYYNFNQELFDIKEIAKNLNIKVFEINGKVKNHEEALKYNGRYLILGQYQSASEAIDGLQHMLSNIIYYSPTLSSTLYSQSMGRIHRIGQTNSCSYYRFITIGTIEEDIYKTIQSGKDYTEKLFSG